MAEESKMLRATELTKAYPASRSWARGGDLLRAVDRVSMTVDRGAIKGLIGESGCGKSTFGKTVTCLTEATSGAVEIDGHLLFDTGRGYRMPDRELARLRRDFQVIFQDPLSSLNPRHTLGRAVETGIRKHHVVPDGESKDYAMHMLRICGMDETAYYKYPRDFSGGQRQRVGIARVLALRPKFVVCDEPTSALDTSIQSQILNLMLDLKDRYALTYLLISHNFSIIRVMCDQIAVMYLGRIVEEGPAEEIACHPAHPYTRLLLDSVPSGDNLLRLDASRLSGSAPSALELPAGCRFCTRCPYATGRCREEEPELRNVSDGHQAACHLV